ncbi:MAG: peptide MFS transporter [Bacteroidetes bacterium]|nr:peptide MFS transporter [Bacteroidota bacterium]
MATDTTHFFKSKVLGHPSALFVLFFTEMWERFSFYGMRVLLVNFLTMAVIGANPGWGWTAENAGALFGTYAGLLYLTPIVGGIIADRFTGYRNAVVIGAAIMTAGHASMALETEFSLYAGLALLVIGTGFFKPNITSMISTMYKDHPEKKDGAYTIFYMGVNAGAFFGMMLCGYLAERIGWSWGFGLAGIFMFLGTLQFWLAKPLFGVLGEPPKKGAEEEEEEDELVSETGEEPASSKRNPFTMLDKVLIFITATIGLFYLLDSPLSAIADIHILPSGSVSIGSVVFSGATITVLIGLVLFLYLIISRIIRYPNVNRDRMIAVAIFAFFTVFFWMSFEQGASSLIIFARDWVDRTLSGGAAIAYNVVNTLLTVVPLAIVSWVLFLLWKQTFKKIPGSNIVLVICFLCVWGVVGWMLNRDYNTTAYEVSYDAIEAPKIDEETGNQAVGENGEPLFEYTVVTEGMQVPAGANVVKRRDIKIIDVLDLEVGNQINIIQSSDKFVYLDALRVEEIRSQFEESGGESTIVAAEVAEIKDNEVEITVSWFSILNSFFIIAFASFFSKWFESKYNPSAAFKYAFGLILLGIGFGLLAFGSFGITAGVKVSMLWLILAYLFHTLGELSLSPVGLSYVSKLVPARMIGFMFGIWYLAIAIGNKLAGTLGGQIDKITEEYSLSTFFLFFTIIPIVAGLVVMALNPLLKKLMHGVR